ncbi:hypothetical protein NMG29_25865 [Streptomyces cocklensis]|uniref:Uncharacterized protein n=1 Tax=Actinacidiphila cocklensis TaxID=887465 RepID=A0A9W4DMH8_9ACTN|nr:hypothetical protein [Actinacidiphila cocklensis]MDD1061602.1 hypothetical protein [Actinacidiphila cocklensis]CAG6392343.1 conserved hypothetical protein [Actinacidiphila cocklensis]
MSGATKERPSTEPGATRQDDGQPQPAPSAEAPPTWTITTTTGYTAAGYLPPWAEDDPSATDVPPQYFATELADITHHQPFSGLGMTVSVTDVPGAEAVILSGSIDCAPYSEDPTARLPVVNLQLVDDYWLHNLDPDQLAAIATQLRTQADHLDHEVRPALITAREDWTTHHNA